MSDADVALAKKQEIDIAVDLKGFTFSLDLNFSHKFAPVQISYLGYPGTLGAKFIDYMIADKIVIPDQFREYYSKILFSYQILTRLLMMKIISEKGVTRKDLV